jgi:hypothetical protein
VDTLPWTKTPHALQEGDVVKLASSVSGKALFGLIGRPGARGSGYGGISVGVHARDGGVALDHFFLGADGSLPGNSMYKFSTHDAARKSASVREKVHAAAARYTPTPDTPDADRAAHLVADGLMAEGVIGPGQRAVAYAHAHEYFRDADAKHKQRFYETE